MENNTDREFQACVFSISLIVGLPIVGLIWLGWKGLVTGLVLGFIFKGYVYFN